MIAIVLAAGEGTRLETLPKGKNKCILEIEGKPILSYTIDALKKHGIDDIYVVVGYSAAEVKRVLGSQVKYIYNPFYKTASLVASIGLAKEKVYGKDFLLVDGDMVFDPEILEFLKYEGTILPVEFRECNDEDTKILVEEDFVTRAWKFTTPEFPKEKASGEYTGFTKFTKETSIMFFDSVMEVLEETGFKGIHMDVINKAIEKGARIRATPTRHKRTEIDFKEDFEKAQEIIKYLKVQNKL